MEVKTPERIVDAGPLLLAGICRRYTYETMSQISGQWAEFGPQFGNVPGQVGFVGYGVSVGGDSFQYLSGVEVRGVAGLPDDFYAVRLPAQTYAVFPHHEHISTLCDTIHAALKVWLPASEYALGHALDILERYDEEFDPEVLVGHIEVWVPIHPK